MIKALTRLIIVSVSITHGLSQDFLMLKQLWIQMALILMIWNWALVQYQ